MRRFVALALAALVPAAVYAAPKRAIVQLVEEASLAPVAGDPEAVIRALQETATRSQAPFVKRLAGRGAVVETQLWATNALIVRAEPAVLDELAHDPAVASVTADTIVPLPKVTQEPVDTKLDDGEVVWSVQKIGAPDVWAQGLDGTGVTVGLVDTGADGTHPDLAGKIVAFHDFIGTSTTAIDGQGHGTHTAGTIAGCGKGGKKTGVAPGAKLIVARVFSEQGASTADLLKAMQWIMDPDGNPATNDAPRVCSNSWGSNSQTDKSFWNVIAAWRAAGIFPSFAAGNAGPRPSTVGIPGGYPISFAAGATDSSDGIASFSSRGPISWDGVSMIKPDVSAPGHKVISCKDGGGYWSLSGTSMACPHVTGLVALMLQGNPSLKIEEIETILRDTSIDLGAAGNDNDFGRGRIDAKKACAMLSSGGVAGAVTDASGKPVAAHVQVDAEPTLHDVDPSGKFKIRLADGVHHLVFAAYGFKDAKRDVTIDHGGQVALDVTLDAVPTGTLTGRVMSKGDGKPIAATLTLAGAPIPAVTAAADGTYSIRAAVGHYTLVARSRRFGVAKVPVEITGDVAAKVEMAPVQPLLLVNAANDAGLAQYYARILSTAVSGYDTQEVGPQGQLDSADALYPYETVVWFTGTATNAFPESAQKALVEYMKGGGRMLISGQDVSSGIAGSTFFHDVLHAKVQSASVKPSTQIQGIGGDPVGAGIEPFSLVGGTGANNQHTPDAIAPADGHAVAALRWNTQFTNKYAALRITDGNARAVYFGFGLESVASDDVRSRLLTKSLEWLKPTAQERADRLAGLTGEARADYIQHLTDWLGVQGEGEASRELLDLAPLLTPEPALRELLRKAHQ